jgi:peptidoglycan/LPS O-acetylase OafA/YrhL
MSQTLAVKVKSSLTDLASTALAKMLPSLLAPATRATPTRNNISETAFMSGIRGLACVIVYVQHWVLKSYPFLLAGYGSAPENFHIFQLPFLRFIVAGKGAVSVFYVVSGFALSYTPLRLVHEGRYESLLDNLASGTFRRVLRLYLPTLPATMFTALWFYAGSPYPPFPPEVRQATFLHQMSIWWKTMLITIDPFQPLDIRSPKGPPYASQLWTLPYEARGSFIVFGIVLGLSRVKAFLRAGVLLALALYTLLNYQWDIFLFISGIFIAEARLLQRHRCKPAWTYFNLDLRLPPSPGEDLSSINEKLSYSETSFSSIARKCGAVFASLICMHILAFPITHQSTSFGYRMLVLLTPKLYASQEDLGMRTGPEAFWLAVIPPVWIFLICHSSTLQYCFTTRFMQWLSDISFSLYIVHSGINNTLGTWLLSRRWEGWGGDWAAFGLSTLIIVPVTFWIAHIYWRFVDLTAIAVTKWLDKKAQGR